MKTPVSDPKKLLEALLAEGGEVPFPPEAASRARALARAADAPAPDVEALPEPLALAVLEASVRARRPGLAEALAASPSKALVKAAKRALYQLRSMGVELAEPEKPAAPPAPAPAAAPAEEFPCLLSPIAGTGERALLVVHPLRGGGLEAVQAVLSDGSGVVNLGIGDLNRSSYRRQLRDLRSSAPPAAIEITREEARELFSEAAALNLKSRTPFPQGMEDTMRQLGAVPREDVPALPPPTPEDATLAMSAHTLHDEPELQAWLPPEPELRVLAQKMDQVVTSPLQLSDAQRSEQLLQVFRGAAEAFFTPEMKRLYARRLWAMADFFARTGREKAAELARAEARRLFHGAPGVPSRFGELLFEKVLHLTRRAQAGEPLPAPGQPPVPSSAAAPLEKKSPGGLILP